MDGELYQGAAYSGSKDYTQQQVKTANATGFGAAADDYAERGIDLNEQLIRNKPATFFMRVRGEAMVGAGIFDGDTVIVDRSIKPVSGKVVIAVRLARISWVSPSRSTVLTISIRQSRSL
jgi:DNA polymerase V